MLGLGLNVIIPNNPKPSSFLWMLLDANLPTCLMIHWYACVTSRKRLTNLPFVEISVTPGASGLPSPSFTAFIRFEDTKAGAEVALISTWLFSTSISTTLPLPDCSLPLYLYNSTSTWLFSTSLSLQLYLTVLYLSISTWLYSTSISTTLPLPDCSLPLPDCSLPLQLYLYLTVLYLYPPISTSLYPYTSTSLYPYTSTSLYPYTSLYAYTSTSLYLYLAQVQGLLFTWHNNIMVWSLVDMKPPSRVWFWFGINILPWLDTFFLGSKLSPTQSKASTQPWEHEGSMLLPTKHH